MPIENLVHSMNSKVALTKRKVLAALKPFSSHTHLKQLRSRLHVLAKTQRFSQAACGVRREENNRALQGVHGPLETKHSTGRARARTLDTAIGDDSFLVTTRSVAHVHRRKMEIGREVEEARGLIGRCIPYLHSVGDVLPRRRFSEVTRHGQIPGCDGRKTSDMGVHTSIRLRKDTSQLRTQSIELLPQTCTPRTSASSKVVPNPHR